MTITVRYAQGGQWVRAGRTPPPAAPTIFGFNVEANDTFNQTLAGRQAWWNGRAPCIRKYRSSFLPSGAWPFSSAELPEKRVAYSVKPDSSGTYNAAGLAAGNGNARVTALCSNAPANTKLWFTYFHEPQDNFRSGAITIGQYRDTYEQFRTAIDAATLNTGVTVKLTPNFNAYLVTKPAYFDDTMVPPLGVADLLTFDVYGNPGEFTSQKTGPGYGTTYPVVATRWRDVYAAIERNGFAAHWGVLEMNTPGRDWDTTPIGEALRRQWLVDSTNLALHPPMAGNVPAEIFLYWEADAAGLGIGNWNQHFGRVGGNPRTCADALAPYILGTPVGG